MAAMRSLVLVDVENLLGDPAARETEVIDLRREMRGVLEDLRCETTIVACSHYAAPAVRFGWPDGRHHWRSGRDGADDALLDALAETPVVGRYDHVVIASGDHSFTDAVAGLARLGIHTVVVSRPEALSTRLRLAAHEIRPLHGCPPAANIA